MCAWYDKYLGTGFNGGSYVSFEWANENGETDGQTAFSFWNGGDKYFNRWDKECMLNFRVDDLEGKKEKLN